MGKHGAMCIFRKKPNKYRQVFTFVGKEYKEMRPAVACSEHAKKRYRLLGCVLAGNFNFGRFFRLTVEVAVCREIADVVPVLIRAPGIPRALGTIVANPQRRVLSWGSPWPEIFM